MWYTSFMAHKRNGHPQIGFAVTVGARGRIVLPAALRSKLRIRTGHELLLSLDESGAVTLRSLGDEVDRAMGMCAHLKRGRSMTRELIRERRLEAKKEGRK